MCNFKRLLLESTYAKIQDLSRSISRTSYYVTRRPIFCILEINLLDVLSTLLMQASNVQSNQTQNYIDGTLARIMDPKHLFPE